MISESSHNTQDVEGPIVVNNREFLALDIAARRAFWFSLLWRSCSSCDVMGGSKSWRSIVMLANLCSSGPFCVIEMADWSAEVAELPSRVFGMMKPRAMREWG